VAKVIARVARFALAGELATFEGFVPSGSKVYRRNVAFTTQHHALTVSYRANRQAVDLVVGTVVPSAMLKGHTFRTANTVQEYRKMLNETTKVTKAAKAVRKAFVAANVL
jgi:hypothetical protein